MRKSYLTALKTLLFLFLPFWASAQYWEAGLSLGYSNYLGDLVEPVFTFKNPHPAANLSIRYFLDDNIGIRLNIMHGKISGDDNYFERNTVRGNAFETNLTEFALLWEVDPKGHKRFRGRGYRKKTTPYFFTGLGLILADPRVTYGNPDNEDAVIDYPDWHVSIPVGGGLKIDIHEKLYFGIEAIARLTLSDNLDGTQESGHAYRNDVILNGGITIGYRFVEREGNENENEN